MLQALWNVNRFSCPNMAVDQHIANHWGVLFDHAKHLYCMPHISFSQPPQTDTTHLHVLIRVEDTTCWRTDVVNLGLRERPDSQSRHK